MTTPLPLVCLVACAPLMQEWQEAVTRALPPGCREVGRRPTLLLEAVRMSQLLGCRAAARQQTPSLAATMVSLLLWCWEAEPVMPLRGRQEAACRLLALVAATR